MKSESPVHLLMRFSNEMSRVKDVIEAHRAVIDEHKAVWLGKMGKPLGMPKVDKLNAQSKSGVPTYVFMVQRVKGVYQVYRGTVLEVARRRPERALVPPYYLKDNIVQYVSLWIKLSQLEKVNLDELSNYRIASSGMAVPATLTRSMAALFFIKEGKGLPFTD